MRFGCLSMMLACATLVAPLRAQERSLAGTYEISIETVQGTAPAIVVLTQTAQAYRGRIAVFGFAPAPLTRVTVAANALTLQVDPPEGRVFVKVRVEPGNVIVGTLGFANDPRPVRGTFHPADEVATGAGTPPASVVVRAESALQALGTPTVTCDFTPHPVTLGAAPDFAAKCHDETNQLQLDMQSVRVRGSTIRLFGFSETSHARIDLTVGADTSGTLTLGSEAVRLRGGAAMR